VTVHKLGAFLIQSGCFSITSLASGFKRSADNNQNRKRRNYEKVTGSFKLHELTLRYSDLRKVALRVLSGALVWLQSLCRVVVSVTFLGAGLVPSHSFVAKNANSKHHPDS